jgi:hypothetical protein
LVASHVAAMAIARKRGRRAGRLVVDEQAGLSPLMKRTPTVTAGAPRKSKEACSSPPTGGAAAPFRSRLDQEAVAAHDSSASEGDRGADTRLRPLTRAGPGSRLGIRRPAACYPPGSRGEGAEGAAFVRLMRSDLRRDDDAVRLPGQRRGVLWPGRSRQRRDLSDARPGCGTDQIGHHLTAVAGGWRDRPGAGQSLGQHVKR